MRLGIVIEGGFDNALVAEAALKYKAQEYVYPAELHLDKVLEVPASKLHPMHLNAGFGDEAPYDRVFRLLQKVDALLVFASRADRGVVYAAIKKARNYSMPVEIHGCDGQIHDKPNLEFEETREVDRQEGSGNRGSTASAVQKLGRAQAAEVAVA